EVLGGERGQGSGDTEVLDETDTDGRLHGRTEAVRVRHDGALSDRHLPDVGEDLHPHRALRPAPDRVDALDPDATVGERAHAGAEVERHTLEHGTDQVSGAVMPLQTDERT